MHPNAQEHNHQQGLFHKMFPFLGFVPGADCQSAADPFLWYNSPSFWSVHDSFFFIDDSPSVTLAIYRSIASWWTTSCYIQHHPTCHGMITWNGHLLIWLWINTYRYHIFSGMNIHESQLFWCELQGYYWFWHTAISHGMVIFLSWRLDLLDLLGPSEQVAQASLVDLDAWQPASSTTTTTMTLWNRNGTWAKRPGDGKGPQKMRTPKTTTIMW